MDDEAKAKVENVVRDVEWWMQVNGSYWREPQGPGTDVFNAGKARYPVVQVVSVLPRFPQAARRASGRACRCRGLTRSPTATGEAVGCRRKP